jgi:hypothetical protein
MNGQDKKYESLIFSLIFEGIRSPIPLGLEPAAAQRNQ